MQIGILALQGGFIEHQDMLKSLGVISFTIRQKRDLQNKLDALIIPGGESTVIGKLLHELGLFEPLKTRILAGLPVFGTCAGLIVLAKTIEGENAHFASMDIEVKRNAYGRQLGSFFANAEFDEIGKIPMTFIRAPIIKNVSGDAKIMSEVDGQIVAARQNNQLVTAFHPELGTDLSVHRYFIERVIKS